MSRSGRLPDILDKFISKLPEMDRAGGESGWGIFLSQEALQFQTRIEGIAQAIAEEIDG
jgi:hypothetical protein